MANEAAYSASAENVKYLGRTYFSKDKLYCALSGSGVEFCFRGTGCKVVIEGDSTSGDVNQAENQARIAICVNGERVIDDMVDKKTKEYTVFASDTPQDVTVSVIKLSESAMSVFAIDKIVVDGTKIGPASDKDTLIEFVGDSITCGYGVDDPVKEHHFSTKTEDVTKAYAYKTAQLLNADYSMVSYSGHGIISGYTEGDEPVSSQLVPPYYTKLGFSYGAMEDFIPSETEWDFTGRQPDAVVINLGTNDDSYTKSDCRRQQAYQKAYVEFIKSIRKNNPGSKIVCTLGIMGDRLFEYVRSAVDTYKEETGDGNIDTVRFDVQLEEDGYSADWHPSVITHDKAAQKLAKELKSILMD